MAPSVEIVGREAELASVEDFLRRLASGPVFLVIEGEAGIGKTTVWDAGVARARERSYRVLVSRPTEAETTMSYAALGDVLEPVLDETLRELPVPQRQALEVALVRRKASRVPPEPRTLGVALVNVLRAVADVRPVVVAVDDMQWLDVASARVLDFALRRLDQLPIGLLATSRSGDRRAGQVALAFASRVALGPLDTASLDRVVRTHLNAAFAPPTLHRLHSAAGGNPFFAVEIGRALLQSPAEISPGDPLPIPDDLHELVRWRLESLPARTRAALVAAAALSRPTLSLVLRAAPAGAALDKAESAGVIRIDGDALTFSHPVLAAAAYASATPGERRRLHRRLADLVEDREEHARHLALAAEGPDEAIAAVLEDACEAARGRGAPSTAAELGDQAWRLTPPAGRVNVGRRKIAAAEQHLLAGDPARARTLLEDATSAVRSGPLRARGLVTLAVLEAQEANRWDTASQTLELALREVGDDDRLRADVERQLAWSCTSDRRVLEAEPHAQAALELAERLGDRVLLAEALATYAHVEFQRGRGLRRDIIERALALDTLYEHPRVFWHPHWPLQALLHWIGDYAGSRASVETLLRVAHERGEENARPWLLWCLSQFDAETGCWAAALRRAEAAHAAAVETGQDALRRNALLVRADIEAHQGEVEEARSIAEDQLRTGNEYDQIGARGILGFIALSLGDAIASMSFFEPLLDDARRNGVEDPSVFPFWADAVEGLIGTGDIDRAERVLAWLEERGRKLDRPWAIATGGRCRALLDAARGDLPRALAAVEQALCAHGRLQQPFELGRTLLVKGRIARRAKQKRVAREALEQAIEIFDRLGAALWSKQAREELGRIGGRAAPGELTPTQLRIAELVAGGHTNREVAEALFVTVKTVEANLSKIYRKVGVASRRELARDIRSGALNVTNASGVAGQT